MTTESSLPPQPKRMGRPRLSSPERRRRVLASKAKWRDANREYYRAQINRLSSRPEYKARRRELRAKARAARAREEGASVDGPRWDDDLVYDENLRGLVPRGTNLDESGFTLPPGYTLWDYVPQRNDAGGDPPASDEGTG